MMLYQICFDVVFAIENSLRRGVFAVSLPIPITEFKTFVKEEPLTNSNTNWHSVRK